MDQYQSSPPPTGQQSVLAVVSLILGILSLPLICCTLIDIPLALGAIICGHLGVSDVAKNGKTGGGMAKAGLIMGYVAIVVTVGLMVLSFAVPNAPSTDWNEILEQIQNSQNSEPEPIFEPTPVEPTPAEANQ